MPELTSASRQQLVAEIAQLRAQLEQARRPGQPAWALPTAGDQPAGGPSFQAVAEGWQTAVMLVGADRAIRFANPALAQIYGYSADECARRGLRALTHPDDRAALEQRLADTAPGASSRITLRGARADGTWPWLELTATNQLLAPAVGALVLEVRDITARRLADVGGCPGEEWLRMAHATADLGTWRHNLVDGMIHFDPRGRAHYGFDHDAVPFADVVARVHLADIERLRCEIAGTLDPASDRRYSSEYRIIHPGGGVRWLAVQARLYAEGAGAEFRPVFVVGTSLDITDRRRDEEDRRRYAERLAGLHAIDRAILQAHSFPEIADAVLVRLRQLVPCQCACVRMFGESGALAELSAVNGSLSPGQPAGTLMQPWDEVYPTAFQHGEPWVINSLPPAPPDRPDSGLRAIARIPLIAQGQLVGSLNLLSSTPNAFTAEHIAITREVADQLMLAIHTAQLIDREQRARRIAEGLHAAGEALARQLTLSDILDQLLDVLRQLIPYDSANVMVREGPDALRVRYMRGYERWTDVSLTQQIAFEMGQSPHLAEIVRRQSSMLIADTAADRTWRHIPGTEHIGCWMGVPLVAGNEVVGIYSIDKCAPNTLTTDDVRLAETLAATAATAIVRVRLFEQLQRELAERSRAEQALIEERGLLARRVDERTADLQVANAELARAARLKDEFLASMSHELRTPLNAILGRSEVLGEEVYGPLTERQRAALHSIEESGRHLLALINDILDLSKIEAGKLTLDIETLVLDDLCRASMRMVAQSAVAKQIGLSSSIDGAVDLIQGDVRRLKQILVNLLSNAVKFTPRGGQVGLEVRGDAARRQVTFTVWDTGIGIAPADLPQLFQTFVQIDSSLSRQYEGTGLGLALVLRLAEAHGGSVSVESVPGAGSRFSVTLAWAGGALASDAGPLLAARAPASLAAHHDRLMIWPRSGADRPLILVADDNQANSAVLLDYLPNRGYQVCIARNGAEAVARARERQPALILMDIQMPEVDGLEATRRIRADPALRATPIIALTALAMPGDRERCLHAGADEYLTKPVHLHALLDLIAAQLARAS